MVCTASCVHVTLRISISGKEFEILRNRMLKGFILGNSTAGYASNNAAEAVAQSVHCLRMKQSSGQS